MENRDDAIASFASTDGRAELTQALQTWRAIWDLCATRATHLVSTRRQLVLNIALPIGGLVDVVYAYAWDAPFVIPDVTQHDTPNAKTRAANADVFWTYDPNWRVPRKKKAPASDDDEDENLSDPEGAV